MKASYSPTMEQMARELGVSVSTVSRVLNGREARISSATKERVVKLAARLGYSPNFLASSLSRGRGSGTIGICMGLDEFNARVVDGIIATLWPLGYAALTLPAREGGPSEQEVFRAFVERRVEGVIMRPSSYDVKSGYFKELDERGLPIVMVDAELHDLKMPFSGCDDYEGGRLAAEHLLSLGHEVLGHVAGDYNMRTGVLRRAGFLDAVKGHPGACAVLCRHEGYIPDSDAILALLDSSPRPTAVFAANDILANAVYEAAMLRGLRIPEDLSVVGFAGLGFASSMHPPLTTFDQKAAEIGCNAVELLMSLIKTGGGTSSKCEARLVSPSLIQRASTARLHGGR
jgi:LacI family transcriptional regulator